MGGVQSYSNGKQKQKQINFQNHGANRQQTNGHSRHPSNGSGNQTAKRYSIANTSSKTKQNIQKMRAAQKEEKKKKRGEKKKKKKKKKK